MENREAADSNERPIVFKVTLQNVKLDAEKEAFKSK